MAKTKPTPPTQSQKPQPSKLPLLPKNTKITKRPLLHPPIASPRTGSQTPKVIYISTSSPFISVVKRVRKYLSEIDKRALGKIDLHGPGDDRQKIASMGKNKDKRDEEVLVKATGKAIEKVLQVALFFQGEGGLKVRLRTGSVGAIDDLVVPERKEGWGDTGDQAKGKAEGGDGDEEGGDGRDRAVEAEVVETRIRRTSMLEVGISFG